MFERRINGSAILPLKLVGPKYTFIDLYAFSQELGRLKGQILFEARERQYETIFLMEVGHVVAGEKTTPLVTISWERPENKEEREARKTPAKTNHAQINRARQDAEELAQLKTLVRKWPTHARGFLTGTSR